MAFCGGAIYVAMIIFIFGQESFLVARKFEQLKNQYLEKNPQARWEVFDFDDDVEMKNIENAFKGGESLFSAKKCLILRNVFSISKIGYDKLHQMIKAGEKYNGDLTIMIVETQKPKGKLSSYLKKNAKVFEFGELNQGELTTWIKTEVESRSSGNVTISDNALRNLCEITQCNLWNLNSEIEKLIQFCSDGKIESSDLEKISKGQIETGIFDLVDAIGVKNKSRAIELKNNLVMQGDNEFYIFSMIHTQLRNILKVGECVRKGINDPGEISKRCSIHPFVARKTQSQQGKFEKKELKKIFLLASKIDKMAKSGKVDIGEALDYFIVKV